VFELVLLSATALALQFVSELELLFVFELE